MKTISCVRTCRLLMIIITATSLSGCGDTTAPAPTTSRVEAPPKQSADPQVHGTATDLPVEGKTTKEAVEIDFSSIRGGLLSRPVGSRVDWESDEYSNDVGSHPFAVDMLPKKVTLSLDREYALVVLSGSIFYKNAKGQELQEAKVAERTAIISALEACARIPNLVKLELDNAHYLGSESTFRPLANLRNLQHLEFDDAEENIDAGLYHLENLSELRTLIFSDSNVTDSGVAHLAKLQKLERLSLSETAIGTAGLAVVGRLKSLKELDLSRCERITDDGLSRLTNLVELEKLNLGYCPKVTNLGVKSIGQLTGLRILELYGTGVGDDGLAQVGRLKKLRELSAGVYQNSSITDEGVAHLGQLSRLEVLQLRVKELSDAGLSPVGDLRQLRELSISVDGESDVTAAGVRKLAGLTQLRSLSLPKFDQVSDDGLAAFAGMNLLEQLNLTAWRQITGTGMSHLGSLVSLKSLDLGGCHQLSDAGMPALGRLPSLETLSIKSCNRITDEGVLALRDLKTLKRLNVNDCPSVSYVGMIALRQALPESNISLYGVSKTPSSPRMKKVELTFKGSLRARTAPRSVAEFSHSEWNYLYHISDLPATVAVHPEVSYDLNVRGATVADIAAALSVSSLDDITLSAYKLNDASLAQIANQRQLTGLRLSAAPQVTDTGFLLLRGLTKLEALSINALDLTDGGMQTLRNMSEMRFLRLSYLRGITDAGLANISRMSQLEGLAITRCPGVSDAGISHIKNPSQIVSLSLYGCPQVSSGVATPLAKMSKLRELNLSATTSVADASLRVISTLAELDTLYLNATTISDAELLYLAKLPKLSRLELNECDNITLVGIRNLAALPKLRTLDVGGAQLAGISADEIKKILPRVKVILRPHEKK